MRFRLRDSEFSWNELLEGMETEEFDMLVPGDWDDHLFLQFERFHYDRAGADLAAFGDIEGHDFRFLEARVRCYALRDCVAHRIRFVGLERIPLEKHLFSQCRLQLVYHSHCNQLEELKKMRGSSAHGIHREICI